MAIAERFTGVSQKRLPLKRSAAMNCCFQNPMVEQQ
jgi:hypothetical protein